VQGILDDAVRRRLFAQNRSPTHVSPFAHQKISDAQMERFYFGRTGPHCRKLFNPYTLPLNVLGFKIGYLKIVCTGRFVLEHLTKCYEEAPLYLQ
jgi:hypothetical protein